MQLRKITALFVLVGVLFARSPLARACAVCVSGSDGSASDAYGWSVLFLMTTPYLVVAFVAGYLVWAYRRAVAKKEQEGALSETSVHLSLDQKESGR